MLSRILNTLILILLTSPCFANDSLDKNAVNDFIQYMHKVYEFDKAELKSLFSKTNKSKRVLNAISRPAERLPWYKYQHIFLQPGRVHGGVTFWQQHEEILKRAESIYGVPPHIIVAIIGVETAYGGNKGGDRVMDALSTLAFHYPKRSRFFRSELEQFLLLAREQNLDPLSLEGSYAGAMGLPQFIPSSYRNYAVDFDDDGKVDIWDNPEDAIGSVANYFKRHGWEADDPVAINASVEGIEYKALLVDELKPTVKVSQLGDYGIIGTAPLDDQPMVKVLSLQTSETEEEIWLCFENFYVITRYNHSPLYAMAVYQLSKRISDEYEKYKLIN